MRLGKGLGWFWGNEVLMTEHKQVKCQRHKIVEEVDSGVANLIETLWRNKIDTYMSCQDNDGYIWIQFSTKEDFLRFLKEVDFSEITIDEVKLRKRIKNPVMNDVGFRFPKEAKRRIIKRFK